MAGSDLDGDLYFVTWHEELMLKKENELAMHFPSAEESHLNRPINELDIIDQLKINVESDNKGRISRQHLIFADQKGIGSDECIRLAELSAQMYDAPKTGMVPHWPRELRTKLVPDFLEKNDHRESYESTSVLGELYHHSKSLIETVKKLSTHRSTWNHDEDNDEVNIIVAEMANTLQESYSTVMRNLSQTYGIPTEVNVWRARFPDFKFTDEERQKHRKLIEVFRDFHRTMQTQHTTAVRELQLQHGITESHSRHQLHCQLRQLSAKPFCAGLALMLYEVNAQNCVDSEITKQLMFMQIGKEIVQSLTPASKCRLLTADYVKLLASLKLGLINPIYLFLQQSWLLASVSFLVERLCRSGDNTLSKLDCIVRVLLHVGKKLDLYTSSDSIGLMVSIPYHLNMWTYVASSLVGKLQCFSSSTDENDFQKVGNAIVCGLWDIYTKQETSKENGYEDWEWELKDDAIELLLRIAFRNVSK